MEETLLEVVAEIAKLVREHALAVMNALLRPPHPHPDPLEQDSTE